MTEQLTIDDPINFKRNYVCSQCWGEFVITIENGKTIVTCDKCGQIEHFVTKNYVERRRQESKFEEMEARYNLRDFIPGFYPDDKRKAENKRIFGG